MGGVVVTGNVEESGAGEVGQFVYELIDWKYDPVSKGLFWTKEKANSVARKLLQDGELLHPLWWIVKREVQ